jgi:uncharacterized protein (TIGR02246 family)
MSTDEQAIRDLVATWCRASAAGDADSLSALMDEDVVFLTAGQPPMRGKAAFMTAFTGALQHVRIDSVSAIQEVSVEDNLAYCWNHLTVTATPLHGGEPKRRSGYALSLLRKVNGRWVIYRDANLLTAQG